MIYPRKSHILKTDSGQQKWWGHAEMKRSLDRLHFLGAVLERVQIFTFIDNNIDFFSKLFEDDGLNIFLQLFSFLMKWIKSTHLILIVNQSTDELFRTWGHQILSVLGDEGKKTWGFNFINLSGYFDDEIGERLDIFLVVVEILHVLDK